MKSSGLKRAYPVVQKAKSDLTIWLLCTVFWIIVFLVITSGLWYASFFLGGILGIISTIVVNIFYGGR